MSARIAGFPIACVVAAPPLCLGQQGTGVSFDSNGVPVHYLDKGRGEPVILIHGFTGSAARHWEAPGVIDAVKRMTGIVPGLEVIELPGATHASSVRPSAEPLVAFLNKHRSN
jgi:hypothetical protein